MGRLPAYKNWSPRGSRSRKLAQLSGAGEFSAANSYR
jgi:hypothetical protein